MRSVETRVSQATGKKSYVVRFRYGGKQTSESFTSISDAQQFAKVLDALGAQGALDWRYPVGGQNLDVPTLDEVAEAHIAHLSGITDGTRQSYTNLWARTWAKQRLAGMPVNQVTRDDVALAVNVLAADYSKKSLENQRGLLVAVLGRAVDKGFTSKNVAKGIRLPRGKEGDRVEMTIIAPADWPDVESRILEHYRPFVRLLYGVGCRWGEAVALQVQDWQAPNLRIRRALKWSPDGNHAVGATKTKKSNRTVTVPRALHDELDAACNGKKRTDLIFTAPRGGMIDHRQFWGRVWFPAVEHLEPRPRIHDLRHSHASILLANGQPLHVVQRRLGHESIQTTVDTYTHLLPDAQVAAAAAAELAFGAPAAPGPDELLQAAYAALEALDDDQVDQVLEQLHEARPRAIDAARAPIVVTGDLVDN